ncbi:MAG: hypothetical protein VKP62_10875 [Candidatus Sericytochromatia bacterium]|nr:hypothetical protein [Candidatus Sericytochromatia bacterium]
MPSVTISRAWPLALLSALQLAACAAPTRPALRTATGAAAPVATPSSPATIAPADPAPVPTPTAAASLVSPKPATKLTTSTRELNLTVYGLAGMAPGAAKIMNSNANGLIAAGGMNLIAAGGMNLIAAGGMNLVSGPRELGGMVLRVPVYTLKIDTGPNSMFADFRPVVDAVVTFNSLRADGTRLTKEAVKSDANGQLKVNITALDEALEAQASFSVNGKTYRVMCPVPVSAKVTMPICPIYAMVTSRMRSIIKETGRDVPLPDPAELQKVWDACNESGQTITPEILEDVKTPADITKFYEDFMAKIADPAKKKTIADFLGKIKAGT